MTRPEGGGEPQVAYVRSNDRSSAGFYMRYDHFGQVHLCSKAKWTEESVSAVTHL
jgi:hypothetical protein